MLSLRTSQCAPARASRRTQQAAAVRPSVRAQAQPEQPGASTSAPSGSGSSYKKEWISPGGLKVIETTEALRGPEDEKDPWEGDALANVGEALERYFLPALVVLGLAVGGFAISAYNDGATVFLASAPSDEDTAILIPAEALQQPASAPQ